MSWWKANNLMNVKYILNIMWMIWKCSVFPWKYFCECQMILWNVLWSNDNYIGYAIFFIILFIRETLSDFFYKLHLLCKFNSSMMSYLNEPNPVSYMHFGVVCALDFLRFRLLIPRVIRPLCPFFILMSYELVSPNILLWFSSIRRPNRGVKNVLIDFQVRLITLKKWFGRLANHINIGVD